MAFYHISYGHLEVKVNTFCHLQKIRQKMLVPLDQLHTVKVKCHTQVV